MWFLHKIEAFSLLILGRRCRKRRGHPFGRVWTQSGRDIKWLIRRINGARSQIDANHVPDSNFQKLVPLKPTYPHGHVRCYVQEVVYRVIVRSLFLFVGLLSHGRYLVPHKRNFIAELIVVR